MTDAIFYTSYPDIYKYIYSEGTRILIRNKSCGYPAQIDVLCGDCAGDFCAWQEINAILIIYFSTDSKVKYIRLDTDGISRYTLNSIKSGITLSCFGINFINRSENLYYTAELDGSSYLLKCRLDNNDPVETIARLSENVFYVDENSLYYTAADGRLILHDFSDARAQTKELCSGGTMCHGIISEGERLYTYKKEDSVYFRNLRICDDPAAEFPILVRESDKLMIQWKSRNRLCYAISYTNGKTWSGTRKIVYSNSEPTKFYVFTEDGRHVVYGARKKHEITLFERTEKSSGTKSRSGFADNSGKIRLRLEKIEKELSEIKNLM